MRRTVLVVHDDPDYRQKLVAALRATTDMVGAGARSAEHAVAVLATMRVDVIVLHLSGAAALAALDLVGTLPVIGLADGSDAVPMPVLPRLSALLCGAPGPDDVLAAVRTAFVPRPPRR